MSIRAKIAIDHWLGWPLCGLLNPLVRVAGKLLGIDHRIDPAATRTIAVAKYFGLGSILQSTPLLAALRRRFPAARFLFVTSRAQAGFLARLPYIDEVLTVDDGGPLRLIASFLRLALDLRRRRVDHFFDLEVFSAFGCLVALAGGARNRIGFFRHVADFKRGIYTHLMYFNPRHPVREAYLQLGRVAGAEAEASAELSAPKVEESDRRELATLLGSLPSRRAVVNVNASGLLLERRWPAERFAAVMGGLAARGFEIFLTGSPAEAPYVASVVALVDPAVRPRVRDVSGRLPLGPFLALLEAADLVISNDTGPMHFSIALGRPTVCLFGPVHPGHYGMPAVHARALYRPVYCSPCVHEILFPPCAGENECMRRLSVEEVLAAVDDLLAGRGSSGKGAEEIGCTDADGKPLGMITAAG